MSVELDPVELGFNRPFNHEVSKVLRLYNPNQDPLAFKVKTTAPKQYCVRPNSGRIEPGKDVEVQVLLQAMKEDPPPDARCRDKFLVQSVAISADNEFTNISQVWSHIEQTAKSSIQEKKIRVLFLPADGSAGAGAGTGFAGASPVGAGAGVNGARHSEESAPAYNSPSPTPRTPQRSSDMPSTAPVARLESTPADNRSFDNARDVPYNSNNQQSTMGAAASSIANAIPTSSEDLQAQLEQAKSTILRLRQQAEEQGLRQRKSDAVNQDSKERITTGTTGMGIKQTAASGVPVQVVAGLCLLCFFIAYFLF